MKMFLIIAAALALVVAPFTGASAQTTNPAPSTTAAPTTGPEDPITFGSGLMNWFTSSDPTLPMQPVKCQLWTGASYQSGVNIADDLGARYCFTPNLSVEAVTRNAGIAGTLVSEQAGLGASINYNSIKLTGGVDGVREMQTSQWGVTAYVEGDKAITKNTFIGSRMGIERVFSAKNSAQTIPVFTIMAGVLF